MSGEPRRAHDSDRGRGACWPVVAVLGLLGGFATPDTHAQATVPAALFGNPSSIAVGAGPLTAMVTADVNLDNKPDLIALYPDYMAVAVMMQSKKGTLGTPTLQNVTGGDIPQTMTVADVNGDGKPDVVTGNNPGDGAFFGSPCSVSITPGDGKGDFYYYPNGHTYGGSSQFDPWSVAVSDVNGDGKPGIVTGGLGTVNVWLQGTFTIWGDSEYLVPVPPGWMYTKLAVGDLNGDGKPDIVATAGTQVIVLLNTGNGTFAAAQPYGVAAGSIAVALGDVNADGKLDIVTTGTEVGVLLNNGDGTLAAAYAVGPAGSSVVVADFNKDGRPDLAQIDGSGTSVDVILNTSTTGGKKHK
jgi:hypothetical protein